MAKALNEQSVPQLKTEVLSALNQGAKKIAAFDADGTLWDTDIGENFFKYQVNERLVKDLPKDPWAFYSDWHQREPEKAYLWLAQISKGVPITEVRSWAKAAVDVAKPVPIFRHMAELISELKKMGVEVYIVTASVKWAVEPAAELIGVSPENVLGIETEVIGGLVTEKQKGPITWRKGKAIALNERTGNKAPVLAAGNTLGDLELIKLASHVRLAHVSVGPEHGIHETERALLKHAMDNDWFYIDLLSVPTDR